MKPSGITLGLQPQIPDGERHWRGKSRVEDIEAGLLDLVAVVRARGIRSIAIPPLGAGLGGLDWNEVRSRIERTLGELTELKVIVFEPQGVPERSRGLLRATLSDVLGS